MLIRVHTLVCLILLMCFMNEQVTAQRPGINKDEAKVPIFTLPELLKLNDGVVVETAEVWQAKRRLEIFDAMATNVYGFVPNRQVKVGFKLIS